MTGSTIEIIGVGLTAGVLLIQGIHYILSLANAKAIGDIQTEMAREIGSLKAYMHENFVSKTEFLTHLKEK